MTSSLRGLPTTYVVLGEDDPLKHQGEAIVDAMQTTDVNVRVRRLAGMGGLRMDWALADPDLLQVMLEIAAVMRNACDSREK